MISAGAVRTHLQTPGLLSGAIISKGFRVKYEDKILSLFVHNK